jgi:3'-5' exoribonuclease
MTRRFLHEYGERETLNDVFLAGEKQLRKNRAGNLYLQLRLSDRSGSVNAMMWNANESSSKLFENGDYVRVEGVTQVYNGALQVIANHIERAEPGDVNEEDFFQLSTTDIDKLTQHLRQMLRSVGNPHLNNLSECFLMDEHFMGRFTKAPAGVKNHHAYLGGLLDHVVSLMRLVRAVAPLYPQLDDDLLVMGAFLHDLGKIEELSYQRDLGYTDEGQLLGHVLIGMRILEVKILEAEKLSGEKFPEELALRLKHMVASHHGEYEFGSPKLPMTFEAMALHLLDNLDAKIDHFQGLIREDVNTESHWTSYQANLSRKIFKSGNQQAD